MPTSNTMINLPLSGTSITLPLSIANGGTGQTTQTAAIDALLPSQTSNNGKFLSTNGTDSSWQTVSATVVAPVTLTGSSDVIQLTIKSNATQNADLQEWQDSIGNVLASVDADGGFRSSLIRNLSHAEIIDLTNGILYQNGPMSVDWFNQILYTSGSAKLNWSAAHLIGGNQTVLDWSSGQPNFPNIQSGFGTAAAFDGSNNLILNTSSLRFKEDVQPVGSYFGKNLIARNYHRKNQPKGTREVGLVAEEAAQIIPEIVIYDKENLPFSINFNAAIAVLFSKIGELEAKLKALEPTS